MRGMLSYRSARRRLRTDAALVGREDGAGVADARELADFS